MTFKGIDVRQEDTDWLVIRALLLDSAGAKVVTGSALLYLYEVQSDGSLKSFDFYDKAFKTTALIEETLTLGHRTGNGGATNTGIWTAGFQVRRDEESSSSSLSSSSSSTSTSLSSQSSSSTSTSLSSLSSSSTSTSLSTSSLSTLSSSSQSVSESSPAGETEFTTGGIYIAMVYHASASPPWQAREFQWGSGMLADVVEVNGAASDVATTVNANVTMLDSSATALASLKAMCDACTVGAVVTDGSNTATTFKTNLTVATTNFYGDSSAGGAVLAFTSGANAGLSRRVTAFNFSTDFVTVEAAFPNTPSDGDDFVILGRIEI